MRLFIGIDLPDTIKQNLFVFQTNLKTMGLNGAWKSKDSLHITLEFLGEIPSESILNLIQILKNCVSNKKQFKLNIIGINAFPSFKRPHTIWVGVGRNLKTLEAIWNEVHSELENNGFILQKSPFRPHITLLSRPKHLDFDLSVLPIGKLGDFIVSEIILFESKVENGKRVYIDLFRANLKNNEQN